MEILPAILEKTFSRLENKIQKAAKVSKIVSIDFCDGHFVPSKTFASNGREDSIEKIVDLLRKYKLKSEWDIMCNLDLPGRRSYRTWIENIKRHEPKRVIIHLGSTSRWAELFQELHHPDRTKTEIGLGVHLNHSLSKIDKVFSDYPFSYIQLMGIRKVGYSGQSMSTKTPAMIKNLADMYPGVRIQIDGGVKIENVEMLKKAGALSVRVTSGLFGASDIKKRFNDFKKI